VKKLEIDRGGSLLFWLIKQGGNDFFYNKKIEKVFIVQNFSKDNVFQSQISLYGFISEMIPTPKFFPKQFNDFIYSACLKKSLPPCLINQKSSEPPLSISNFFTTPPLPFCRPLEIINDRSLTPFFRHL
jgi:hypothetical protein